MLQLLQDQSYHQFADQRTWLGVPNFANVVSNLLIALAGPYGLRAIQRANWLRPGDATPWSVVAWCAPAIAAGSAYYHLQPNDATLVWDRAPMSVAFMAVFVALLNEFYGLRQVRLVCAALAAAGLGTVAYWQQTGDLAPYMLAQFLPMAAIAVTLVLRNTLYGEKRGWWQLLGLYAAAKLVELFDHGIDALSAGWVSGHPLKHAAAALGLLAAFRMIERRAIE